MLHKKQLPSTSKIYPKYYQNGTFAKNEEYFYRGERYVCVKTCSAYFSSHPFYNDGTELKNGDYEFFKVKPIKWEIRNWDEMPKEINPNSSGTAKFMDVVSQKAIIGGIPYYVNVFDTYGDLWQNSTIRGFLNGTDVCNIQTNGNPECLPQMEEFLPIWDFYNKRLTAQSP